MDYQETFSLVVKPTFEHLILSLATSQGWTLHHLDVNNAFFRVHYLRMSICLNLLALLIETPLTLFANSIRPFMASSSPPVLGTMSYVSTYFMLAFPTLRQTPLCSSTMMTVGPSIFYSILMILSLLATPTQSLKTSSPLFLIGSPSRTLVLYTIS